MAAFVELMKSRRIVQGDFGVTVIRYWKGLYADLTLGADGFVATGPGAIGTDDTWTSATWANFTHTPKVVSYDLDPHSTKATAIIRTVGKADRVWY